MKQFETYPNGIYKSTKETNEIELRFVKVFRRNDLKMTKERIEAFKDFADLTYNKVPCGQKINSDMIAETFKNGVKDLDPDFKHQLNRYIHAGIGQINLFNLLCVYFGINLGFKSKDPTYEMVLIMQDIYDVLYHRADKKPFLNLLHQ